MIVRYDSYLPYSALSYNIEQIIYSSLGSGNPVQSTLTTVLLRDQVHGKNGLEFLRFQEARNAIETVQIIIIKQQPTGNNNNNNNNSLELLSPRCRCCCR
mmetsp:Transcript_32153/g.75622  ORF Transcript_32153/g.75622 Transcript_32153/m.75622 type:complete len:100 (+) Transcript_32153:962-1261(+)